MNKSELMTIVSDVLLENSKLSEGKIEEIADLVSDAILLNTAEDEIDDISSHEVPIDGFSEIFDFGPEEY